MKLERTAYAYEYVRAGFTRPYYRKNRDKL